MGHRVVAPAPPPGLDLAPASATGPGEHGFVVLGREMRTQDADGGEGHRPGGESLEDDRKVPAGACRLDAIAGRVLGEPKHLRAVGEERAVAFGSEERGSSVELSQVGDELDRCLALIAGEDADAGEEIVIGEAGGESEDVRVHVRIGITVFFGPRRWAWSASGASHRSAPCAHATRRAETA
jgi:hypothetical protein